MSGPMLLFLLFAAFCLAGAYGVAFARSPLVGAAWLLLALFGVAGLFAQAGAHFLAAMQVLVYAGATAVLFVFVIMLLNLSERDLGMPNVGGAEVGGLLLILALLVAISMVATRVGPGYWGADPEGGGPGATEAMGGTLLGSFVGAFEVISVLLLAAMGGAVMLTKRAHGAADAIAAIQRTRAKIDKRTKLAFAADPSLPDQQGPPAKQQPAAEAPPAGVKKTVYGPGETL